MRRPCNTKDEALLMLVHGQLSPWQAFLLKSHASRCPACRARLRRYGALSGALATVLASPGGGRPLPSLMSKLATPRGMLVGLIVVGTLLAVWLMNGVAEANEPANDNGMAPASGDACATAVPAKAVLKPR